VKQDHPDLSVRRQCSLLSLARSGLYYQPRGESAENLKFMAIIDRQFLETPWYGSRQMPVTCNGKGIGAGAIVFVG
jgi:putative transposase